MTDGNTRRLGDRYDLGEVIGRGGMATVRRAFDTRLGREVAVKELRVDLASDAVFQERFRREAQAAAGLNHPNIVAVYDTGEEVDPHSGTSVPYIVMELVEGRTLRDILRDGRPILPRRALEFTLGILDALAYSHKAGIVHRDIKPANVMITPSGMVKVMDFGIARAVADTSSTMTQTAAVIGTAQYLSPEQARGETVDQRSDLYSAGCVLYELLVGRPPFQGESPVSVAYQHVREMPTPPSELDTEITPAMDAVTLKALAKTTADRYQTAAEMSDDIRRLLAGQGVTAVAPPPPVYPVPVAADARAVTAASAVSAPTAYYPAVPDAAGSTASQPVRRRSGWLWPVITGLLLLALIAGSLLLVFTPNGRLPVVPALKGLQEGIAVTNIRDRSLVPEVKRTPGPDDDTVGLVTDQNPQPEVRVEPSSTVTITVNVGPNKSVIPDGLVGLDVDVVEAKLRAEGFVNIEPVQAASEPGSAVAKQVLSVEPAPGTRLGPGERIRVTYATGEALVPNVTRYTQSQAEAALNDAGFFNLKVAQRQSGQKRGTVVDTSPVPGTKAKKSDWITLYLAVPYPPQVTVTRTVIRTSTAPPVAPPSGSESSSSSGSEPPVQTTSTAAPSSTVTSSTQQPVDPPVAPPSVPSAPSTPAPEPSPSPSAQPS